jgi:hypothetical protein
LLDRAQSEARRFAILFGLPTSSTYLAAADAESMLLFEALLYLSPLHQAAGHDDEGHEHHAESDYGCNWFH